jgi:hypothetical protein
MNRKVLSIDLDEIFADELRMIQKRRNWAAGRFQNLPVMQNVAPLDVRLVLDDNPGPDLAQSAPAENEGQDGEVRIALEQKHLDLVGLALSGGGIRSASFGLGVLQGLSRAEVFRRIDYLSTVSGGGYIGSALCATAYASWGEFAFDNVEDLTGIASAPLEIQDSPTVRHIRNYSNFLAPRGLKDWVDSAALLARGIVTNALVIAPYLLLFAALTLAYNPTQASLTRFGPYSLDGILANGGGGWLASAVGFFAWPVLTAGLLSAFFLIWSIRRSTKKGELISEFAGISAPLGGIGLIALLAFILLSLQTQLLAWVLAPPAKGSAHASQAPYFLLLVKSAFFASPLVVFLVSSFGDRLAQAAREEATKLRGLIAKQASRLALLAGAAALPLMLWLGYLRMVYWGLKCGASPTICLPSLRQLNVFGLQWLPEYFAAGVLGLAFAVLLLVTFRLSPNAYSLHRLYRDRLARAFIVHPNREDKAQTGDRDMLYKLRISQLVRKSQTAPDEHFIHGPFPLMNTALNVQASAQVNRRGRNAEFFVFTPLHAGSPATGYVPIKAMEQADDNLNLAAIMAISGAAANSNMGANTIRPLSTTLALLNVRLGYWLPNPKQLIRGKFRNSRSMFLLKEMTSSLDENTDRVLLTDGGHIENLGIYELLRRRCKLIVVADAEADVGMNFPSFIALQRYARIDLGIRIDLPWQKIAETTRAVMAANADKADRPAEQKGPHSALGIIHYDNGTQGYLLYLKSSLTGDENDYVRDYSRRNPSFPHETTADQFFSEEQFEVYRALGFHVAFDALNGQADIAMPDGTLQRINKPCGKQSSASATPAGKLAAMLGL